MAARWCCKEGTLRPNLHKLDQEYDICIYPSPPTQPTHRRKSNDHVPYSQSEQPLPLAARPRADRRRRVHVLRQRVLGHAESPYSRAVTVKLNEWNHTAQVAADRVAPAARVVRVVRVAQVTAMGTAVMGTVAQVVDAAGTALAVVIGITAGNNSK
jgi:hypothetical protein